MKVLLCVFLLVAAALAAPNPDGRIIGGSNADRGQFPFIVSLQYCIAGVLCQHSCGASIITPSWVVTAAHCVTELPGIGSLRVLAGILNLDDNNIERQYINTAGSIVHPDYQGGVNPHDIAVIKLASALLYNQYVQRIPLPVEGAEPVGQSVLAGWGSTGGVLIPQMPNTLQRVNIPLLSIGDCKNALDIILSGAPHPLDLDSNVCTGPLTGGISACSGDSGGPLIQDDTLIGIVSWGITPCGSSGAPSVYVKASQYVEWIRYSIDEPLV